MTWWYLLTRQLKVDTFLLFVSPPDFVHNSQCSVVQKMRARWWLRDKLLNPVSIIASRDSFDMLRSCFLWPFEIHVEYIWNKTFFFCNDYSFTIWFIEMCIGRYSGKEACFFWWLLKKTLWKKIRKLDNMWFFLNKNVDKDILLKKKCSELA